MVGCVGFYDTFFCGGFLFNANELLHEVYMLEIKPGKYSDLSNEDYHAHTDSISRSAIMDFAKSPRTYWANYLNPAKPEKKSTPAMIFGEQFHKIILENQQFYEEFVREFIPYTLPKVGLLKDIGREEYDIQKSNRDHFEKMTVEQMEFWKSVNANKKIVLTADWEKLDNMMKSLRSNIEAWDLLTDGKNESSYFWEDSDTGFLLKARPDILHGSMVVDLKTARDASPRGFQNAMCAGGYHIQAAMILDAVRAVDNREIVTFINVCIEKEYPYSVGVYIIDPSAINAGREKYKHILKEMKKARETNSYLDYETQIVGLPNWYGE